MIIYILNVREVDMTVPFYTKFDVYISHSYVLMLRLHLFKSIFVIVLTKRVIKYLLLYECHFLRVKILPKAFTLIWIHSSIAAHKLWPLYFFNYILFISPWNATFMTARDPDNNVITTTKNKWKAWFNVMVIMVIGYNELYKLNGFCLSFIQ